MLTLATGTTRFLPAVFNGIVDFKYVVFGKDNRLSINYVGEIKVRKQAKDEFITQVKASPRRGDAFDLAVIEAYLDEQMRETLNQDPYYYINKAYYKSIRGNEGHDLMITDFRIPEELEFLKKKVSRIQTVRVYDGTRSEHFLEHRLDNFQTDFLLIPENNYKILFTEAVKQFPQYSDYHY